MYIVVHHISAIVLGQIFCCIYTLKHNGKHVTSQWYNGHSILGHTKRQFSTLIWVRLAFHTCWLLVRTRFDWTFSSCCVEIKAAGPLALLLWERPRLTLEARALVAFFSNFGVAALGTVLFGSVCKGNMSKWSKQNRYT